MLYGDKGEEELQRRLNCPVSIYMDSIPIDQDLDCAERLSETQGFPKISFFNSNTAPIEFVFHMVKRIV